MRINALLFAGALLAAVVVVADEAKTNSVKPYPLDTCIISGEKFSKDMEPYTITNGNQEVKFCCKGCLKKFQKDPAGYLKKIDEAAVKQEKK